MVSKLIEVAMLTKVKNSTQTVQQPQGIHQDEVEILREMSRTLAKAK